MNFDAQTIAILVSVFVAGWAVKAAFSKYAPNEKTLALRAGIIAMQKLAKLQSSTPEQVAAAASAQAHEAALLQQFKDIASKL